MEKQAELMAKLAMDQELTPEETLEVQNYVAKLLQQTGMDPEDIIKQLYKGVPRADRRPTQAVRDSITDPKIGRNDPCPCGSGVKYKKCHGRAV